MLTETPKKSSESDTGCLNFKETELTLGLPGESRTLAGGKIIAKRGFSETVDLNIGSKFNGEDHSKNQRRSSSFSLKPSPQNSQVVGWPPVRSFRKNVLSSIPSKSSCSYVKVAVDGVLYLRKVDLEMYGSYQELLLRLEKMFTCFTTRNHLSENKFIDRVNGTEYVPTYEDKDGDWMLVGDVPWKMFVESCKRLRLMISSEAIGLAPRTPPKCTSTA